MTNSRGSEACVRRRKWTRNDIVKRATSGKMRIIVWVAVKDTGQYIVQDVVCEIECKIVFDSVFDIVWGIV